MDIELRDVHIAQLFTLRTLLIQGPKKVLIHGPSGRGKTSLLHLIGGLWRPSRGEILLDGRNVCAMTDTELSELRRRRVGFIFQKMNLIEHMTARENLQLVYGTEDPDTLLKQVGLENKASTWAGAMSLGEQQRLAVARVLRQQPELILADEPTSSLDESNAENVLKLLFQACQKKTLIMVSHDLRLQKHFELCLNFEELVT